MSFKEMNCCESTVSSSSSSSMSGMSGISGDHDHHHQQQHHHDTQQQKHHNSSLSSSFTSAIVEVDIIPLHRQTASIINEYDRHINTKNKSKMIPPPIRKNDRHNTVDDNSDDDNHNNIPYVFQEPLFMATGPYPIIQHDDSNDSNNDDLTRMSCGHVYHTNCLSTW